MAKTTLKVRAKAWDMFNRECKAAALRRDDFLNNALSGEIEMLKKIVPCDAEGERWLKRNWIDQRRADDTELKPVPIFLSDEVLEAMNMVCEDKRVPRDAFFDCALAYFVERLYESVVVIKTPRTGKDLVSQIAFQLNDIKDDLSLNDTNAFLLETVQEWAAKRRLEYFADDYYQTSLSVNAEKVDEYNLLRELFNTTINSGQKGKSEIPSIGQMDGESS